YTQPHRSAKPRLAVTRQVLGPKMPGCFIAPSDAERASLMSATPRPLVLIILDGFGHSDNPEYNAIHAANTPVYDRLRATYPHGLISGSGMDVGLPDGQMGNSEVGHMNLGAGRVVYQDFTRVTKRSEQHTSELQSRENLVCSLLLEKKKN